MDTSFSAKNTSVVLLAAGHGTRMMPLTADTPKPLLKIGDSSLIEHHIIRLERLGFRHIVINIAYLGTKIKQQLGDGKNYGLTIEYSDESETGALETAGGLKQALSLIKSDPFLVVNADIWTDFDFTTLLKTTNSSQNTDGCLVMVPNPSHNIEGDFAIDLNGTLSTDSALEKMTFSGIALYRQAMYKNLSNGKHALGPLFKKLIGKKRLNGISYEGAWYDIGTPERLIEINKQITS